VIWEPRLDPPDEPIEDNDYYDLGVAITKAGDEATRWPT
jgi:hypothetical protein